MEIKILIADSVSTMRENIKSILENEGFTNILEADNGESACEIFENELPEIVIMDFAIPGKSGMESLRDMMKKNPDSKVIICSASSHRELVIEAVKLGAADFILKPLKPERLIQAVKKAYSNI
ncbi:MAG: response regulator [Oscillospiraceae bacterium]|nr:response regulator [Oscillospiraceae bacterium]